MSDATVPTEKAPGKKSFLPLIAGVVLAVVGGAGSYYAISSGLLHGATEGPGKAHDAAGTHAASTPLPDVSYVSLPQLIVSLGPDSLSEHLIFRADLEVPRDRMHEVESILPRVVDVLNSYLRALEPRDLQGSSSLVKLRAQMLRRIQLVTGEDRVSDLLVMEFVLK